MINNRITMNISIRLVWMIVFFVLVVSCVTNKKHTETKKDFIVYPQGADTAKIQFLTSISSTLDVKNKKESKFKKFVTGEADEILTIKKPTGIDVKNAKIYIADVGLPGLEIIDLEKGTMSYFIPDGIGALVKPVNCKVDEYENLFVLDIAKRKIIVFNKDGKYIKSLGAKKDFKPIDFFIYGNKICVLNSISKNVEVYSKEKFELLNSFPDAEVNDEGYLYNPKNIFVKDNIIYVTDFGGFTINKYTFNGEYLSSVGGVGTSFGQFARPKGIAVDNELNLYAVDANFANVQIFNDQNQLLMFFGGHYKGKGDMILPFGINIDYDNINYFQEYVDPNYNLVYLIIVTNQMGPDKINLYGRVELKKIIKD
jgi:hypothetical protein